MKVACRGQHASKGDTRVLKSCQKLPGPSQCQRMGTPTIRKSGSEEKRRPIMMSNNPTAGRRQKQKCPVGACPCSAHTAVTLCRRLWLPLCRLLLVRLVRRRRRGTWELPGRRGLHHVAAHPSSCRCRVRARAADGARGQQQGSGQASRDRVSESGPEISYTVDL